MKHSLALLLLSPPSQLADETTILPLLSFLQPAEETPILILSPLVQLLQLAEETFPLLNPRGFLFPVWITITKFLESEMAPCSL